MNTVIEVSKTLSGETLYSRNETPPLPSPESREICVKVAACAVNPVDARIIATLKPGEAGRVIGWDAAGIITAVGKQVTLFKPGDSVYYAGALHRAGSYATHQVVDERLVGRKPANLSFQEAAALPLTTLTAWESLFERHNIPSDPAANTGRSILIINGAGGVGSMAIQLAKRIAGLTVVATASRPASQAWCQRLGSDLCFDHHGNLLDQGRTHFPNGFDYILCCHDTDQYWPLMAELIKPQGKICCLVSASAPLDLNLFKNKSVTVAWEFMFTRSLYQTDDMIIQHQILNRVANLLERGQLQTTLKECLGPLTIEALRQAHKKIAKGSTIGKLVLSALA